MLQNKHQEKRKIALVLALALKELHMFKGGSCTYCGNIYSQIGFVSYRKGTQIKQVDTILEFVNGDEWRHPR